jgi:hypothetical protein
VVCGSFPPLLLVALPGADEADHWTSGLADTRAGFARVVPFRNLRAQTHLIRLKVARSGVGLTGRLSEQSREGGYRHYVG